METRALTTGEISKYCGVHFRTVIRWIERGQLRAYKLPGRGDNRVPVDEFVRFLKENNMPIPEDFQDFTTRILVVDDDENMANTLKRVLRRAGYEPETAYDGLQAGVLLESFKPALLTLDLQMPGMSGHEVLKFIRSTPSQEALKILVVSGAGQAALDQALQEGADAVMAKPFENEELLETIRQLIGAGAKTT